MKVFVAVAQVAIALGFASASDPMYKDYRDDGVAVRVFTKDEIVQQVHGSANDKYPFTPFSKAYVPELLLLLLLLPILGLSTHPSMLTTVAATPSLLRQWSAV